MIQKKDMISIRKKIPKPYVHVLATDWTHWVVVYREKFYDVYSPDLYSIEWTLANVSGAGVVDFNLNEITHWMPLPKRRNKK